MPHRAACAVQNGRNVNVLTPGAPRPALPAVGEDFPIVDYCNVAAALQELHHFFAFACDLRPAGLGFGVLLEAAEWLALEFEIDLGEFAFCGAADGVRIVADFYGLRRFEEGLLPDGDDAGFEFWRAEIDGHGKILAQ